jgi:hypothetical protein
MRLAVAGASSDAPGGTVYGTWGFTCYLQFAYYLEKEHQGIFRKMNRTSMGSMGGLLCKKALTPLDTR